MIVVQVEGGLGNQLFQVAFGMHLAQKHRTCLVLDRAAIDDNSPHRSQLDRFAIDARDLTAGERRRLPRRYRPSESGLSLRALWSPDRLKRVRERPFGFHPNYLRAGDDSYLVGYWQSDRFFSESCHAVRDQFRPKVELSLRSESLRERMLHSRSVAVHIRRGDYLNQPPNSAILNLSLDYYRACVMDRLAKRPGTEVYVFSNDIDWCREQLGFSCPTHFVDHNDSHHAHEDLWLMTAAECIVTANSTFSWWGAYLAERPDCQIYTPEHWFRANTLDDRYLACAHWIRMPDQQRQPLAA